MLDRKMIFMSNFLKTYLCSTDDYRDFRDLNKMLYLNENFKYFL